jgi:uncharacterized protein (DUF488 family)
LDEWCVVDTHQPILFTIGHSNHELERLLELLQQHAIEILADVRSQPWSRYSPQFNAEPLKHALRASGIKYLFLGDQLGGRPEGPEFYDEAGYVLYHRIAEAPWFIDGIERLRGGIRKARVALMCSEEDPSTCHRFLLVSRVMSSHDVNIQHIRGDGQLQSEEELRAATGDHRRQGVLFQEMEQDAWRSIRSVSPKAPPNTSLDD